MIMQPSMLQRLTRNLAIITVLCAAIPSFGFGDENDDGSFKKAVRPAFTKFADRMTIESLNASVSEAYRMGPGDLVEVRMWSDERVSGEHLIDPTGHIAIPILGEFELAGKTRKEAQQMLEEAFAERYVNPLVHFGIREYHNNRVFVLGRVGTPGMINFRGRPNLLEALSLAGAIPAGDRENHLQRCAVIRGSDQIIWVDLNELLVGGNMSLNLALTNSDVVYIPDVRDPLVYVMGEVRDPGVYRITAEMSFLDALMQAGGLTEDGKKRNVALIRQVEGQAQVTKINMSAFYRGDYSKNFLLRDGDILYVRRKSLARLEYLLSAISPFTSLLVIREAIADDGSGTSGKR